MACVKLMWFLEGVTHLASLAGVHPIVESGGFVAANTAKDSGAVEFCNKKTHHVNELPLLLSLMKKVARFLSHRGRVA